MSSASIPRGGPSGSNMTFRIPRSLTTTTISPIGALKEPEKCFFVDDINDSVGRVRHGGEHPNYPRLIETSQFSITQREVKLVYAAMMAATALSALDGTIVNTALTTIIGDLGGIKSYTWVVTAYLLTSTAATPLFGKFSDIYGRKAFTQVAIVIFLIGSVLCGAAPNMAVLVLARAVQGIGGGGIMAMSFVVIADIVPPRERGRYVGAFTSIFAVASVAGPLLGGLIVDNVSWRWIFYVNIPLGIIAIWMTQKNLRLPVIRRDTSIDVVGAVLLVSGISSLILTISWASDRFGWGGSGTLLMIALTVMLLGAFFAWEPRVENPMIPLHLFRNHTVQVMVPMTTFVGLCMSLVSTFMPLFLQAVTGVSPTNSGLLIAPMMIGITYASFTVGRLVTKHGHYRRYPIMGTAAGVVGLGMVGLISNSGTGITLAMVGMLLMGLATGSSMPTSTTAIQNSVDIQDLGTASSLSQLCRSLGTVVSLAAFGEVLNSQLIGHIDPEYLRAPRFINKLPEPARSQAINVVSDGITTVFRWALPIMIAAAFLSWMVKELPLRQHAAFEKPEPAAH